jgi:hypothetical protein
MTARRSQARPLLLLWLAAALIWAVGAALLHWPAIDRAWHSLAFDLGERPALTDAERALLALDCDELPSARERARCELDQRAVHRSTELWDAAMAELRRRQAEARATLGFAAAIVLLPPAGLMATGWLIARAAARETDAHPGSAHDDKSDSDT